MAEKYKIIAQKEIPACIPSGICIRYIDGVEEEITEAVIQTIMEDIRQGIRTNVRLALDPYGEDLYMQLESTDSWIFLQYCEEVNQVWYVTYNEQYADSDEQAPIRCSDGQSIVMKKYTTHNLDLVIQCIAYFIRTGQLYPGMQWLKCWTK